MTSLISNVVLTTVLPYALLGGAEFNGTDTYQYEALVRTSAQVGIESMSPAKIMQYYSLSCIHTATNGVHNLLTIDDWRFENITEVPGWLIDSNWEATDVDPCDGWYGIVCNENSEVTEINLASNMMTGSFPPEVMLLASDGLHATGAGMLEQIDLYNNIFLFNGFDMSWTEHLGSSFLKLYFQGTSFAGDLKPLPLNIYELDASYSLISGGFTNEVFGGLNNLNWLVLSGLALNTTVPAALSQLENLEYLYITDSLISGDISYLQGMPKIIENWVDFNPELTGPIYSWIGELTTLESFSITESSLTGTLPTEIALLTGLQQLWFYDNELVGAIPSELGNLGVMRLLQLEGNSFTGTMPAEICANTGFLQPLETLGSQCSNNTDFSCSCCTCCSLIECNPDVFTF